MRISTGMIYDKTTFNLSRNIERLMNVQGRMSSGRRIETPSDDPIGTHHDLNYRARLTDMAQYLSSINQGRGWMTSYDEDLGDLKDMYSSVKEIAVTMANDTYDATAREGAANEVESILEQVLQLANRDVDGRYVFSGHKTRTKPMEASANGVVYRGDRGLIDLEIDAGSRVISNLIGEEVFLKQLTVLGKESDLMAGLSGVTLVSDLNGGTGIDQAVGTFEVYDANRGVTYTIDVSGAATVADVVNAINTQIGAAGNLSVAIAQAGASLQWEPVTGTTNSVTMSTPLDNLNAGNGVDRQPGTFVIRTTDSSIMVEVDISGASTVGDVITAIENALTAQGVAGISVGLNADGNGLALRDTNAVPLGLVVEDSAPDRSTAADLGLAGYIAPEIQGRDLAPRPDFIVRDIAAQTTAADLGLTGSIRFTTVGQSIRPRVTVDTVLASLNNKAGFQFGQLKISQGDQTAIIDLGNPSLVTVGDLLEAINGSGLEITASINSGGTGIQVVPTVSNKTLIIENNDDRQTAQELGIIGSSDMLGTLMLLINGLRNDDRALAEHLIGNLDLSMDELLASRATVGARMIRMDTTQTRLEASKINLTRMQSEVEDADIVDLVNRLAREENLYQAALVAGSKIMQQSLVDFLQ